MTERGDLPGGVGGRRASLFALGVAALLALASCAAERPGRAVVAVPIPSAVTVVLPPLASLDAPVASADVASAETASIAPAAVADAALLRLHGKTRADLAVLLGTPDFVRRDPPAELWQYRSADCILDLFLYPEAGGFQVAHAETRSRQTRRPAGGGCLAGLMQQRKLTTTASAAGAL